MYVCACSVCMCVVLCCGVCVCMYVCVYGAMCVFRACLVCTHTVYDVTVTTQPVHVAPHFSMYKWYVHNTGMYMHAHTVW